MSIQLHKPGEDHARALIRAGKVNDGPWSFDAGDRAKLLGPKGNHVEELARHHLGVEADEESEEAHGRALSTPPTAFSMAHGRALSTPPTPPLQGGERDLDAGAGAGAVATIGAAERFKHPFGKDGEVYTRALKAIRSQVSKSAPEIFQSAGKLLEEIKALDQAGGDVDKKSANPNREVRCLMAGLQLRAAADGKGPGTVYGYAAVFERFSEDLGYFREKIAPGAFSACLEQDVRALVNHDPGQLIGRSKSGTLRMQEDGLGLRVEIDLPDTQVGRDTATQIRRGDLDGMSFSFDTEADSWDRGTTPPTRTLLRCSRVYDVGPVTFPAYTDTSAAMRSLDLSTPHSSPSTDSSPSTSLSISLSLAKARQRLAEANSPL